MSSTETTALLQTDRNSAASYTSLNQQDPTQNKKYVVEEPRDRFFLVHFLFLLFGLLHLMPLTFLITANNYWMHKFRNVSMEHQDVEYRSPLQRYFTAGTAVAEAVPTIVCTLLATAYGHKFLVRSRIFVTLSVIAACYVLCTIFVKINVNSWQTGFYALTMATLATIQTMLAVYQVTSLVLLAKFPGNYMKFFLFGEGVAGIFTSSLQVVCLAIGGEPETSALIYFCTGTFLLILTLVIFKVVKYLDIYDYYVTLNKEDTKRKTHSFTEAMKVAREIWPCLVIFMTYVATLAATHPSVTSLVISENAGKGYTWNDKYFVPVITFLFSDVCSLCGRLCATGFLTKRNGPFFVTLSFIRSAVLIPLVALCHATPRSHLPVIFNHDWQYIIILACLVFTNGFIQNVSFLSIGKLAPGKEEDALLVLIAFAAVATGLSSPLGITIVKIL
ncbi:unnamed protein product [Acanthoscelides obtectus]|uniref:Equilibrative nucleoside transporter 3 n=1 Tax=Acanthoscelides obtectus TaxID=200917 RepID=A0A9P0P6U1_ACAOB|nr:unnamed protein product [Acanthoscelides obtectus]CAK1646805.1 Equilibrative nucleoside transporter 3 [Acanthoscelides obtectus]